MIGRDSKRLGRSWVNWCFRINSSSRTCFIKTMEHERKGLTVKPSLHESPQTCNLGMDVIVRKVQWEKYLVGDGRRRVANSHACQEIVR